MILININFKMKFKFQLFSDLHQEYIKNFFKIPPKEDYLFLCGDINNIYKQNFKPFFDYCSENWKQVFYILGNHEFYIKNNIFDLKNEYKMFFNNNYQNIHLLDDDFFILNYNEQNIKIIGSTLWSHIDDTSIIKNINDFSFIYDKDNEFLKIETFNELHIKSKIFILNEINNCLNNNQKCIIMTHFPPTQKNISNPKYKNTIQSIKNYFSSNFLEEITLNNDNILCWLYGHTHFSNDTIDEQKNIRLISNQLGYIQEIKNTEMNENGIFEIDI